MTTLILVMKHPGNIRVMRQVLASANFSVIGVSQAEELESALAQVPESCIGLIDVAGFGSRVWGVCEALQARGVRFVVLSAARQVAVGGEALNRGAASLLEKPVDKSALLQVLRSLAG